MISETSGVYAVFRREPAQAVPRKVIAWNDDGDALIAHADGYLVVARTQAGFSTLANIEWWGEADLTLIAPGGGERIVDPRSDPPGATSPVLFWGLDLERDLVAVVVDDTGAPEHVRNPVVAMSEDGSTILRDPR